VRSTPEKPLPTPPQSTGVAALDVLLDRMHKDVPQPAHAMAYAALRKLVDYQDAAYGVEYLDELARAAAVDRAASGKTHDFEFTVRAAKYIAQAFAYDDPIRVADLKTRATRFARVRADIGAKPGAIMRVSEFMHPRAEEFCATMPAALGRWVLARPRLFGLLDKLVNRGRRVRTADIFGFTLHTAMVPRCVAALAPQPAASPAGMRASRGVARGRSSRGCAQLRAGV
jgi:indolepyruvate ferredoxin oxidoreductase beta subunit